jgi:hypothetical protein
MNIATTTGYPEMIIYNDYERLLFIIFIYIGDALFALAFGLFAANSTTLPEKYDYVFERLRKMDSITTGVKIKPQLRSKLEKYFAYIVETRNYNNSCLEILDGLLPPSTVMKENIFSNILAKRNELSAN